MKRQCVFALVAALVTACGLPSGETAAPGGTEATVPATMAPSAPTSSTPTTSGPAPTTTAPVDTTAPDDTTVPTTAPTTSAPDGDEAVTAASTAFETWIGHIADGEHEAVWEGMAPTSQASIGRELFSDLVITMSEGWAAWSWAEDVTYRLSTDEAGRSLLHVAGTVTREGTTETTENVIPVVWDGDRVLMSPFEEFGNVAEGIRQELAGVEAPPVPEASGEGRRVVYANADQRVWLVGEDGAVVDSYLVSGKQGVPAPGDYEVFSRSETAFAGHDDITMRYMVRFAHGDELPIGFHAIPNDASGAPMQSEEELGQYRSAGCVRQSMQKAADLYEWAVEGTPVVVLA